MELRLFGSTERFVARIVQGTWFIEDADRDIAIAALRRGLDLGMTHIDTAELYGNGAAEELVGEAIAGRRNEVFLVSKVVPENASQSGTRLACERSLARPRYRPLGLLPAALAWPAPPRRDDCRLRRPSARRQDSLLGVSDVPDLRDALAIAGQGKGRLACNSVYTICRSAPSSTRCCRGAKGMVSRLRRTAPSAMGISRGPVPRAGECSQRSQQLTKQLPVKWRRLF
jgi:Aldo/keto reductase family